MKIWNLTIDKIDVEVQAEKMIDQTLYKIYVDNEAAASATNKSEAITIAKQIVEIIAGVEK